MTPDYIFQLTDEQKRQVDLPHDIEKEKEIILDNKLRALFSPPFANIDIKKFLPGQIDDWIFKGEGFNMAIKEKKIEFRRDKLIVKELKEKESKAKDIIDYIHKVNCDIISLGTTRINAITAAKAEDRKWSPVSPFEIINTSSFTNPQDEESVNNMSLIPASQCNQPTPLGVTNLPMYFTNNIDIQYNENLRSNQNQLNQLKLEINNLENMKSGIPPDNKCIYAFKIGQEIPDGYETILECLLCNPFNIKPCDTCQFKYNGSCDLLLYHRQFDLYSKVQKNTVYDLDDKVRLAAELKIEFDQPMDSILKIINVTPNMRGEIVFHPFQFNFYVESRKLIQEVYCQVSESFKYMFGRRKQDDADFDLPIYPLKLLNIDKMCNKRNAEIFFTDCLPFGSNALLYKPVIEDYDGIWYKPPSSHIDMDNVLTSYYGAQFGEVEIDLLYLRNRTVHYLIFEHSGFSMDHVIEQACYNLKQIQKSGNVKLDFYFLKPRKDGNSYFIAQILTIDEFCTMHVRVKDGDQSTDSVIASSETQPIDVNEAKNEASSSDSSKQSLLLSPYIEEGQYILMAGEKHSGKTLFAASIAASVASGKPIVKTIRPEFGVKKKVLYIDFELGEKKFMSHTQKLMSRIAGAPLKELPIHFEHMNGSSINIHSEAGLQKVKDKLNPHMDNLKLVIIDNIGAISGSGSGDNSGWNKFTFPYISGLIDKGITVVVITHIDGEKVRGGQQKVYSATDMITLERAGDKEKNKRGDIVQVNISMQFAISPFPFLKSKMNLTLNKHDSKLCWKLDEKYLTEILESKYEATEIAEWFNVSGKTIREWRRKNRK